MKRVAGRVGLVMLSIAAAFSWAPGGLAQSDAPIKLFKLVSPRDEIVIGVRAPDLRSFGSGADLDNLASRLATDGQMSVWQYAVSKGSDGQLRQAPLKRIAVFKNDLLRIEPYSTPLPVAVPPQE